MTRLAPAGTAMIASLAKARDIPVIVACEGYKFTEKVQVDSIVYNELGSPSEIAIAVPNTEGTATIGELIAGKHQCYKSPTHV